MFEIRATALADVMFLRAPASRDDRGSFRKLAHGPSLSAAGMRSDFAEIYCSTSVRDVVRGMHFQAPPHQHAKLVWCLEGRVTDVVLDLRSGRDSYGHAIALDLDGDGRNGVYVPEGCAHGFAVRSDHAALLYMVTSVHAPEADLGIRWDGFGFDWRIDRPILSARDQEHPPLAEFVTPF
ncbi:dTDP-4-dehydrorhamnose 3,5-epimerase [Methylobacterium radiotolerans]|uniref:dTDP-4-dehydrorhamnose 3,5-epimerase family protein n=1 Tax=Methylobacterium sp. TaxID=409 RepID=UPI000CBF5505|nr:dTDP-4-dehydrorhamnose 3,5-epimerase family protein [Methylobacterium sp.]PJI55257.1 dTDP-4-dehydrorhamnose 3,5-epimerase [Methylobacterium radiotolerans]RUP18587.1 MAG: dTDP-4-keto-6-deoxy-D-glucose epimerase [Methylobacterium sp.]